MGAKQKNWFEISIEVPAHWSEAVSGILFELGATAVEERPGKAAITLITHYPRAGIKTRVVALGDFLAVIAREMKFRGNLPRVEVRKIEDRSWAEEARKAFKPVRVAGEFWAAPSWIPKNDLPKGIALRVDPGEAFGTGMHPTTRLCAALLIEEIGNVKHAIVLDVGTGTGILAMIAQRAGAGRIIAMDNDPKAIETAAENFKLNNCAIEVTSLAIGEYSTTFNVIVANILQDTLIKMTPNFIKLTLKGGAIIFGGLLKEQRKEFQLRVSDMGLKKPEKELIGDGWVAMRYRL